ncbi:MAG: 3-phosphoshikimate 1-carboxyvinyltransferase, partial [Rhodospirillales bacterium]|nr:3-phosphoshikimate 1-carboxyvinyltransferase [Rhodospirillales bacterium]
MQPSSDSPSAETAVGRPGGALAGRLRVPGDKSISHRAFLISALAVGESRAEGCLESDDVLATQACLRALGVEIRRTAPGAYRIHGRGI